MKTIYFTLLLNFLISTSWSQDLLKAASGRFATELNINPFQGNLTLNNAFNQVKFRYFLSNQCALRLGVTYNAKKHSITASNPYGSTPLLLAERKRTSTLGINLGVEKHFTGTKRLSPYIAAEIGMATKSSIHTLKDGIHEKQIEGAWEKATYNGTTYEYEERGFFKYGVNLIGGFDFYVAKHLYLGYEFAFEMAKIAYSDIDIIEKSITQPVDTRDVTETELSVGPNLLNGIRIGFIF